MSVTARAVPKVAVEDDVLAALRRTPKKLPVRLLYDETGAQLFEQITGIDDYYPTRCELRLLDAHLPAIASEIGVAARVVEPGAGAGIKTKRLLRALRDPASYIGIDVAAEALAYTMQTLAREHPNLELHTVLADFTKSFTLPAPRRPYGKTLVFFPGSTIGNFDPHDAVDFLAQLRAIAGPNARLLLGADGTQDRDALLHAYDDADGVTAAFDKNVLVHLNRTYDATFDLAAWQHRAVWNPKHSRVEMHLVSLVGQEVVVGGETFAFRTGEPIITEYSYKHSPYAMRAILGSAGWYVRDVFTAAEQPMRLWLCEPRARPAVVNVAHGKD
jgi:dimethylhistidine N-methyltransferase